MMAKRDTAIKVASLFERSNHRESDGDLLHGSKRKPNRIERTAIKES